MMRYRRLLAPLIATTAALGLLLAVTPLPIRAAASVQLSLTLEPAVAGPGPAQVVWTIVVTPSGGTVSGLGVSLTVYPASRMDIVGCDPVCQISAADTNAQWFPVPDFSSPIQFRATGNYVGYGDVTGTASVVTETPCPDCAKSVTLTGPAGTLAIQVSPALAPTATSVHVTLTATMNVVMSFSVSSRLPAGLSDPVNVSPAGSWYEPARQMEWSFRDHTSATMSYDSTILAPAGSYLTIQDWLVGDAGVADDLTVTISVGSIATPPPPPSETAPPTPPQRATAAPSTPASATAEVTSAGTTGATPTATPEDRASVRPSYFPSESQPSTPSQTATAGPSNDRRGPMGVELVLVAVGTGSAVAGIWGTAVFVRHRKQ